MMGIGTKSGRRKRAGTSVIVCIYALITLAPIYFLVTNAFKANNDIIATPFYPELGKLTLAPLKEAFELLSYPTTLMNNLQMLVYSSIILVVCSSMAAYSIATCRSKILEKYYMMMIAVQTLPFLLAMVPLVLVLNQMKLLNTFIGTSLVYAANTMAFGIFLYTGNMRTIPRELYEAATIDGCSHFKAYLYVYMPLLKVATGTLIMLRSVFFWNDYIIAATTLTSPKLTPLMLKLYAFSSNRLTRYDLLFAGTLLVSLPIMILFLFLQRVFIKGIVAGAVKG
jgi:raffinose/stachyose/melibiose transport system permease protein